MLNQNIAEGELSNSEVNKLRELLKIINADLASKEDIISKYKHQERQKETQQLLNHQLQDEIKNLKDRNKELYLDKNHVNQQVRELTEMCDNLKNENVNLYNEMQNQSLTILNLNEQNQILRDLVHAKKIDFPENHPLGGAGFSKDSVSGPESMIHSAKSTLTTADNKKSRVFAEVADELRAHIQRISRNPDNKIEF